MKTNVAGCCRSCGSLLLPLVLRRSTEGLTALGGREMLSGENMHTPRRVT